jgi:hypothetical protein
MLVLGRSVSVLANGEDRSTFNTGMGHRQGGGALSPLLFNLVGDVLNKMIRKAADKGYVTGLLEGFRPGGY